MDSERPESEQAKSAPLCPRCGKLMRFARCIPGIGALPELWTFECRECVEAVTEEKPRLLVVG
jgi:hypothetical protein